MPLDQRRGQALSLELDVLNKEGCPLLAPLHGLSVVEVGVCENTRGHLWQGRWRITDRISVERILREQQRLEEWEASKQRGGALQPRSGV